jgi:hypothetical protein
MTDSEQDPADQKQVGHAYNWLGDHGQINYEQLIKLAKAGTSESVERLHELADDNNISYDETTDLVSLAEEIYGALETDGNIGVE